MRRMAAILASAFAVALIFFGTIRISLGFTQLSDAVIGHYAKLGIIYLHVGYWILIAIAVIATKTLYQKKG